MNRAVSTSQVNGFVLRLKTMQSGIILADNIESNDVETSLLNKEVKFSITENSALQVGQNYKVQMAYINDGTVGYYSTVAVVKYTAKPTLLINGLNTTELNSHIYAYQGIYQTADTTERPYYYKFNLYDNENNLIDTSENLLHNSEEDEQNLEFESRDFHTFGQELKAGRTYYIEYVVTTTNGLVVSSPRYRITQKKSINPDLNATIFATLNYDNGYVEVSVVSNEATDVSEQLVTGSFIISRACEDTDYLEWDEIHRFSLNAQVPTMQLCKDFTVEQGKHYLYSIQQYSAKLISNRLLSEIIYVDFEDAFLFDGKKQLKIKYNPKVASFKKDVLETKTDTIGGKHPFIFRNGRVYYSEFSISGLISYQMDEENLFLSKADLGLIENTTNLTSENIAAERAFKMKVLEWLTDGKPKVFRSPTEGNFIVRLMNSSLAPNDTVGRMLHTFTSTAYEIADYNYQSLGDMGFITIDAGSMLTLQWETKELRHYSQDVEIIEEGYEATSLQLIDMTPGDVVKIKFKNSDYEDLKIGVTGSYFIDTGVNIVSVKLKAPSNGLVTYSYRIRKDPVFETISEIKVTEYPGHQFIGEHDILQEILYVYDSNNKEWVRNPKVEFSDIYCIDVEKRPLERIIGKLEDKKSSLTDPFLVYEVGELKDDPGFRPGYPTQELKNKIYYDGYARTDYQEYQPYLDFDGSIMSVNEKEHLHLSKPGIPNQLICGNGCLVTLSYQLCVIEYNVEAESKSTQANNPNHYLYQLKQYFNQYEKALDNLTKGLEKCEVNNADNNPKIIAGLRQAVSTSYTNYILELVRIQKEQERVKYGE